MSIRPLCASTVSGAVLGRAVSSRVLDEVYKVYPEVTSEQMEEVENFLEENQAVKELAGAYLDVMAGSVKDGTPVSPEDYEALIGELKQDVFPQLMDEMGDLLTEEEKNALYEGIDSQSEKIGQIMAQGAAEITEQSYPPVETALELYGFLDSFSVKALSLGVVILSGIIVLASAKTPLQRAFVPGKGWDCFRYHGGSGYSFSGKYGGSCSDKPHFGKNGRAYADAIVLLWRDFLCGRIRFADYVLCGPWPREDRDMGNKEE